MGAAITLLDAPVQSPHAQICLITAAATAKPCKRKRKSRAKYKRPTTYKTREQICRDVLETLTGMAWPNVRPRWLLGEKMKPLEVDMLCMRLSTAVHCDGYYHEKRMFWQTPEEHEETKRNDLIKNRLLEQFGLCVISVPSREKLGDHAIPQYLVEQLAANRVCARKPLDLPV